TSSYNCSTENGKFTNRNFPKYCNICVYELIRLVYRKRINRPNYNQMAPYVAFFGINTFVAGNLSLMPAINDGAEISYQKGNWWVTIHFGNTKDAITQYQSEFDTTANVLVYRSQNLEYSRSYGVNTNFSFRVASWWKMQNYFSLNRNSLKTKHLNSNLKNNKNVFSVNSNSTFRISESITADASVLYESAGM
ncbi:outer membrane beta-barrel protein, partial [Mariniphaga sp.]|uniref:outer membrane beta-barrel protein n=1 Tax=Mariniphaga sp. TaxID=1954475 RepID=UPI0035691266